MCNKCRIGYDPPSMNQQMTPGLTLHWACSCAGPAQPYLLCAMACWCILAQTYTTTLCHLSASSFSDSQPGVDLAPQPPMDVHLIMDFWRSIGTSSSVMCSLGLVQWWLTAWAPQGTTKHVWYVCGDTDFGM